MTLQKMRNLNFSTAKGQGRSLPASVYRAMIDFQLSASVRLYIVGGKCGAADGVPAVFQPECIHRRIGLFLLAPIVLQQGKLDAILPAEPPRAKPQQADGLFFPDLVEYLLGGFIDGVGAVNGVK